MKTTLDTAAGDALGRWMNGSRRDYQVFCDFSRTERIGIIKKGLPAMVLEKFAADMDVRREVVLDWLAISRATASRKVRDRALLSRDESERALGMGRIVGRVGRIVCESGDPEGFDAAKWTAAWLDRPNPALGGQRPSVYMDTADGRALVAGLLFQMQSGTCA